MGICSKCGTVCSAFFARKCMQCCGVISAGDDSHAFKANPAIGGTVVSTFWHACCQRLLMHNVYACIARVQGKGRQEVH
jgi:hypothetical protein